MIVCLWGPLCDCVWFISDSSHAQKLKLFLPACANVTLCCAYLWSIAPCDRCGRTGKEEYGKVIWPVPEDELFLTTRESLALTEFHWGWWWLSDHGVGMDGLMTRWFECEMWIIKEGMDRVVRVMDTVGPKGENKPSAGLKARPMGWRKGCWIGFWWSGLLVDWGN